MQRNVKWKYAMSGGVRSLCSSTAIAWCSAAAEHVLAPGVSVASKIRFVWVPQCFVLHARACYLTKSMCIGNSTRISLGKCRRDVACKNHSRNCGIVTRDRLASHLLDRLCVARNAETRHGCSDVALRGFAWKQAPPPDGPCGSVHQPCGRWRSS